MNQTKVRQLELLSTPQQPQSPIEFSSKSISDSMLDILQSRVDIYPVTNGFALDIPPLESDQYAEFKGLLESLKGHWTGKTHLFDYDPSRILKQVIAAGRVPKLNPFHFHETPDAEIETLFSLVDLPEGVEWELDLLEPSAGRGAIARKLRARLPQSYLDVVEIDPFNQEKLRLDGFNLIGSDFLETHFRKRYDFVLSNPPFDGLSYIKHIERQFSLLKPNGKLAAITPDSMLTGTCKRVVNFRNFVAERGTWEDIGAPFKGISTKCVALTIENLGDERLQKLWEPSNGYASVFQEAIEIVLECDAQWHETLNRTANQPEWERERYLSVALDSKITQSIQQEHNCILYDDRVRTQLLNSILTGLGAE